MNDNAKIKFQNSYLDIEHSYKTILEVLNVVIKIVYICTVLIM